MLKVKILIFPLAIVFSIWLIIWFIIPSWQDIQKARTQIADFEKKLSTIELKNSKVNELMGEINAKNEDRDLVYTFIPSQVKEEEIIDNLNFLASKENLFVYNLSVPLLNKYNNASFSDPNQALTNDTKIEVNFGVVGNYENIKSFLTKVASLERYNNISSLKIENEKAGQAGTGQNSLKASGIFIFDYFVNDDSSFNYEDPIFSESGRLNIGVIEEIRKKTSTEVLNLEIGTGGKSNPFNP